MKLFAAIALILLLAAPAVACDEAGAWQDAIARAVAKTDAAQSYRATGNSTTQDFKGCTNQSSFVAEYSGDDSHTRFTYARNCESGSPGDATTASGNLTFTDWSQSWRETTVVGNTTFVRSSDRPEWRECEVTTDSWPPIADETKGPSIPAGVPTPTFVPIPAPTPPPTALPAPFSPPPTSASSAPTPAGTRVRISSGFMKVGPSRTTAPAPAFTPSESCSVARVSLADSLDRLIDVERLPDEAVDGVPCSHYRGGVDQNSNVDALIKASQRANDDTSELDPSVLDYFDRMRRREYVVELWIDDEGYIRQHRIDSHGPGLDPDTGEEVRVTIVSTTRYFDFNEPIVIEPPDLTVQ